MCGIIGFITNKKREDLGEIAYIGLEMLQHRGQDACGVYFCDFEKGEIIKGLGSVENVLNKENIKKIKGNIFIGQTRYPTTKSKEESQPLLIQNPLICMVHNGHIYNDEEIRKICENKGIKFETGIDLESIMHIFKEEYLKNEDEENLRIKKSVKRLFEELRGAYSALGILRNNLLIAFKDPYGIRPLFMGKNDDSICFASETIALEKLGYKEIEEILNGEILIIDKNLKIFREKLLKKEYRFCSFELVYFSRATSRYKGKQIFEIRKKLGKKLAEIFESKNKNLNIEEYIISPVPETSRAAAEGFSEYFNKRGNLKEVLEKHRYGGRNFIKPSEEIRRKEVFYTLTPIDINVKDKKIILIDDSIVRGTTSKRIVKYLKEKGAKEVHLCITYPPIRYSCFYGIDTPTKEELIAYNKNEEEIGKILGVDSLTYMTIEGLKEIIGENFCFACINGEYFNLGETCSYK
jgi:amidophosphoribosyltransferase